MHNIVLVRHGQSLWNKENRFTGWVNVDLSEKGIEEATNAGSRLKDAGFNFDLVYTSTLLRAQRTAQIISDQLGISNVETVKNWRLNERHYGALQGKNKKETAELHGEDQVKIWRRSFDTPPPLLESNDEQESYGDHPLILGESLKDCCERVIPYWQNDILPKLKEGKNILIAAHGNSLRALMKYLNNISDEEIVALEIATGTPIVVSFNENYECTSYKLLENNG